MYRKWWLRHPNWLHPVTTEEVSAHLKEIRTSRIRRRAPWFLVAALACTIPIANRITSNSLNNQVSNLQRTNTELENANKSMSKQITALQAINRSRNARDEGRLYVADFVRSNSRDMTSQIYTRNFLNDEDFQYINVLGTYCRIYNNDPVTCAALPDALKERSAIIQYFGFNPK